ncbi:protein ABSCISIC ACID-INSENSITIVE 5 [Beta vulgaris subsp. vulgaris]|uniref:protein ABSCISIC ACID-INSENSITIVE 5 n=1 Tax=Beta vulgaris subsp. vulgaris TaxID=3555 RepID=UPI002036B163|nr:protein ABSCISIC ACID-INSENSITIVE 5 [Beta vulgaris subsp. vulgaris]
MVAAESEMMVQPEVNSPAMTATIDPHHNPKSSNHIDHNSNHRNGGEPNNYVFPSLGRQSSIYSLTLDEFQHTLSESGKNFGSMNMDEFLNSIWTAEENQAHHSHHHENPSNIQLPSVNIAAAATSRGTGAITKQPSLPRQGSLTLPAPLCRKTVDEVWTEIQRSHQPEDDQQQNQQQQIETTSSAQRQATFGEMTLEDFLIKAGVVREQCGTAPQTPLAAVAPAPPPTQHPPHHQYGFSTAPQMGPTFVTRPMIGMAPGGAYQPMPPSAGESSGYTGNGKRNNGYPAPVVGPSVACYGGRMNNGGAPGGGFAPGPGLSPVSPVSPEGMCGPGQVDNPGGQYGLDMGALRGRKRIIDGPVEKVVERRQRRMIKNRESAARSRARKQAYTVELEAELNQLREENAQLKQALAEIERQRKQQYREEQNIQVILSRAQRAQDKLRAMRRSRSSTL